VKNLVTELKQNHIPKKLIKEVLIQSTALLKSGSNGLESRNNYKKLVDKISKHHSQNYKKLASAMNVLATAVTNNLTVKPSRLLQNHGLYPGNNKENLSPNRMQSSSTV